MKSRAFRAFPISAVLLLLPLQPRAETEAWGKVEEAPSYTRMNRGSPIYEFAKEEGTFPEVSNTVNIRGYAEARSGEEAAGKVQFTVINRILEKRNEFQLRLDRAYVDWNFKDRLSLRAGKQLVNWGTGYAWNPTTDDINVSKDILDPTNEIEGVPAVRADLLLGPVTVSALGVPKSRPDRCQAVGKLKLSTGYGDYSISAIRDRDPKYKGKAAGADFVLNVEGVGLHAEALYREGSEIQRKHRGKYFRYAGGADYTVPWGTYFLLEYYRTDEGFNNFDDYTKALIEEGLLLKLGKSDSTVLQDMLTKGVGVSTDYAFAMVRHTFDEFDTLTANAVVNARDGSFVAQPKWEHSLAQALNLYVWVDLISPGSGGEFAEYPMKWRAMAKLIFGF